MALLVSGLLLPASKSSAQEPVAPIIEDAIIEDAAAEALPDASAAEIAALYPQASVGVPLEGPLLINGGAVGAHSVLTADFDNDGRLDVVSAARDNSHIIWYRNLGGATLTFEPHVIAVVPGAYLALPADVNGDGKMDVIVVAVGVVSSDVPSGIPGQGVVLWYQNNGQPLPGFELRTVATGLNYPVSAQVGDFDGDGNLDIVVATRDDNSVRWYRNDGAAVPNFAPNLIVNGALGAVSVDAGDIDGNGTLDIVSASENDDRIIWYANNGSGAFTPHQIRPGSPVPDLDFAKSVHLVDVDGDGDLDVVYASEDQNLAGWYVNDGGNPPQWTDRPVDAGRGHIKHVSSGDFDGDGDIDLFAASSSDGTVAWYRNDGAPAPAFATGIITQAALGARWVHPADVDGDGDLDVLIASRDNGQIVWFRNLSIHRNATYPVQGHHAVGSYDLARFVASGDLDGDGDEDIVAVGDDDFVWHRNNGGSPPTFTPIPIPHNQDRARWIYIADLDGDGDNDMVVASTINGRIFWYENNGAAQPSFREHLVSDALEGPRAALVADLDGDGDLDIYAVSDTDNRVAWFENNGAPLPQFVMHVIDTSPDGASNYPRSIKAADFDNDGDLDLVVAAQASNAILYYENLGGASPSFNRRIIARHSAGSEPRLDGVQHVEAADVDGDGNMDIIAGSEVSATIYWFENLDGRAGAFAPHLVDADARGVHDVVAGDADGDGDIDLFGALEYAGEITWYENNGALPPVWTQRVIYPEAQIAHGVSVADVDGDGDLDVLGVARGTGVVAWFENLGGQYDLQERGFFTQPAGDITRFVLSAQIVHAGRAGDALAHLATVQVRFVNTAGQPLTTAELAGRATSVALYLDSNNSNAFEEGADHLLVRETRLEQAVGGRLTLRANLSDLPAAVSAGGALRFLVVVEGSPACGVNATVRPVVDRTGGLMVDALAGSGLLAVGARTLGGATTAPVDIAKFLRINEVVMLNTNGLRDPQEPDEFPDWIEIYNTGPYEVELSGMYLTDSVSDPRRSPIGPGVKIAPYGRIIVIADGEPTQGPLHATFRLNEGGETLALFDTDARLNRQLDVVVVPALEADQAWARRVDGGTRWFKTMEPTPGRSNALSDVDPAAWLPLLFKSFGC